MGLVILPVAAFFFLVWLAITMLAVSLVVRVTPGGRVVHAVVAALVVGACWAVPNAPGLIKQSRLDALNAQCGWTIHKNAPAVEGVYAQELGGEHGLANWLPRYYPQLQMATPAGEKRQYRYGIRTDRKTLPEGATRHTRDVVDFDTNEVLARYTTYDLDTPAVSSIPEMAYAFLTVTPEVCPGERRDDWDFKIYEVLPRAGVKQCSAGAYRSVDGLCCTRTSSGLSCTRNPG